MNTNDGNANGNANANNANADEANLDLGNDNANGADNSNNANGADDKGNSSDKGNANETDEARLARLQRQTNQQRKKLGLDPIDYDAAKAPKKGKKSESDEGFGYGEKAYLAANGIKDVAEVELVQKVMADTGKTIEQVLGSKYFQAELNDMREFKASEEAGAKGKNRGTNPSSIDSVDYWIKKGTLPPNTPENTQLRRDVVNARAKAEKSGNVFASTSVIGA